jgi:hypothetical protein
MKPRNDRARLNRFIGLCLRQGGSFCACAFAFVALMNTACGSLASRAATTSLDAAAGADQAGPVAPDAQSIGDAGPPVDSAVVTDGSETDAPAENAAESGAPLATGFGYVIVSELTDYDTSDFSAGFGLGSPTEGELLGLPGSTSVGPCWISSPASAGVGRANEGDAAGIDAVAAGVVTFSGGDIDGGLYLVADENAVYAPLERHMLAFEDGQMLFTSAAGGVVAPFSTSLIVPPDTHTGSVTLPDGSLQPQSSSSNLYGASLTPGSVTFAFPPHPGWMIVSVDGASTTLMCSYDAAAGSGTIPAAARAAIPVGEEDEIDFTYETRAEAYAGSFRIRFAARVRAGSAVVTF